MIFVVGVDLSVGWSLGSLWKFFLYILEFIEVKIIESKYDVI